MLRQKGELIHVFVVIFDVVVGWVLLIVCVTLKGKRQLWATMGGRWF